MPQKKRLRKETQADEFDKCVTVRKLMNFTSLKVNFLY
jgi:hypothetical protein